MVRKICVAATAWARRRRQRETRLCCPVGDGVGAAAALGRNSIVLPYFRRAGCPRRGKSGSAAASGSGGPRAGRFEGGCSADAAQRDFPSSGKGRAKPSGAASRSQRTDASLGWVGVVRPPAGHQK